MSFVMRTAGLFAFLVTISGCATKPMLVQYEGADPHADVIEDFTKAHYQNPLWFRALKKLMGGENEYQNDKLRAYRTMIFDQEDSDEKVIRDVHTSYARFCGALGGMYHHALTKINIDEGRCTEGSTRFVIGMSRFFNQGIGLYVVAPLSGSIVEDFDFVARDFIQLNFQRARGRYAGRKAGELARRQRQAEITHKCGIMDLGCRSGEVYGR